MTLRTTIIITGLLLAAAGCESNTEKDEGRVASYQTPPASGLLGGTLGPAGGYIIGIDQNKNSEKHRLDAVTASKHAEANPAHPADVQNSASADLNHDGYVTLDEVVAMQDAGLSDQQMIDRLRATYQVFGLTSSQEQFLRDRGVDQTVITAMESFNHEGARTASDIDNPDQVPSQPQVQ